YTDKYGSADGASVFRLHNRHARPLATDILTVHQETRAGDLRIQHGVDTIGLDVEIVGNGHSCYCLGAVLAGKISVTGGPQKPAIALGTTGFVVRTLPETQFLIEDGSERVGVWMDAGRLERTLQAWLGEPPREMLAFSPGTDWASGPGRAVWRMVLHFMEELRDPEGLLIEPVAFETFTDLFMQTVLSRLHHNYAGRLERSVDTAVPRHVRRAEAFMRAFADQPITMPDVVAAAGCGTATLYASFRRFRNTTPLAVLHRMRLQLVREALQTAEDGVSTGSIARRFGFTNPSRFIAAYGKEFGELPNETRRRS
ncbi:MAG: helix-turn-helix transcriptional regulator, partial [Chloroflexi bacterium]|nr:helix-turn-helix transcriptional regulator [Chloroflexota bacterium]